MREILFKAKRIDNGEWVEGYLVKACQNTYPNGYEIIDKNGINYDELDCWQSSFTSYEVDEKTICQYTGLVDKKRNKIWENDIVNHCEDFYVITWEKDDAMFALEDVYFGISESFKSAESRWCEIIGNTIDNPELLDKQIETKFD